MEGVHKFFNFYALPGKGLAHLWYLWPKKGQVWASARRVKSPFVHAFYSTIIYFIAGCTIFSPDRDDQMLKNKIVLADQFANNDAAISAPKSSNSPPRAHQKALSPGFNCKYASNQAERLVCTDRNLAGLDRDLNNIFNSLKISLNGAEKVQLDLDQEKWLLNRDICSDRYCVAQAYGQRINELAEIRQNLSSE